MTSQEKTIQELLKQVDELQKKLNIKPAPMKEGTGGRLFIDPNNQEQWEWYHNDEEYDFDL
ncbi:hypothetical protein SAMN05421734_101174 [Pelagirhabdus alkalitolerans]|uniref:Uncharacterized protein n=1 Tax=Pelagirhabdus alkalitolerans TaxID=1612202 RepID=A0A1G6GJC3_9BACI|nr:hypothetical protein [Pelagirhabdus alkalitolerans]SDB82122.1 hypothetical protein SAMN05421734_101174 [Pelagirhabdus alkalitolerans]